MKRRFSAQQSTIMNDLRRIMTKVNATSLKIQTDEMNGEVTVIFDRKGRRYTKTCQRWDNSLDNLRAVQLNIEYLYRACEIYGVEESSEEFDELFNMQFIGMEATPDDGILKLTEGKREWYEILGIDKNASKEALNNAYRGLARIYHPDVGGNAEEFKRIRKAYDDGLKQLGD